MTHLPLVHLALLASSSHSTHIGPWIVVPILILAAIVATPIYLIRDRRRRRTR
jgi:hypothetical protein